MGVDLSTAVVPLVFGGWVAEIGGVLKCVLAFCVGMTTHILRVPLSYYSHMHVFRTHGNRDRSHQQ